MADKHFCCIFNQSEQMCIPNHLSVVNCLASVRIQVKEGNFEPRGAGGQVIVHDIGGIEPTRPRT